MSTSWCGCKSCHHEYYGNIETKCSWCGGETKILEAPKPVNVRKIVDDLSRLAKAKAARQENSKRN